jgi:Flp pilus assembly protein TadD
VSLQSRAKALVSGALAISLFVGATAYTISPVIQSHCDAVADVALQIEDYTSAVQLHRGFLRLHPTDSVAHFHLGFAYGMIGRADLEIAEYARAVNLGLREWDLFLDLGLAYFDEENYSSAIKAFEMSVSLGPGHSETHFNLALAYEKVGRLGDAMREIVAALNISPNDLDERNTKAIICVKTGDVGCALEEW